MTATMTETIQQEAPAVAAIQLNQQQQAASDGLFAFATKAIDSTLALLAGYAGTGKTTIISLLVEKLILEGDVGPVAVAAPTNKAVRVLREKIPESVRDDIVFGSIHSFLGLRMTEKEDGSQDCRKESESSLHEYALVIIDEASMLSRDIFKMIGLYKGRARILFVGDPAQLPPVGDKTQSPVFDLVDLRFTLSEVVRQARDNPIIALSMAIRAQIERDQMTTPAVLADNLPRVDASNACLEGGGEDTITRWALHELRDGRDCRIIAFTNNQVKRYNAYLHECLHGVTLCAFSVGESVIVHEGCEAVALDDETTDKTKVTLHTSEELEVMELTPECHKRFPDIPAHRMTLKRDNGQLVEVMVADDQDFLSANIGALFQSWRAMKAKAEELERAGDVKAALMHLEAKQQSKKAWGMRNAFANIRHVYAITAHKSQGSTFDTAIVDYNDLAKIRSIFDFNRALYVAVTRPRSYLALVV